MSAPARLHYLDFLRLLALFMMIQGHTIYALLDRSYFDYNNPLFSIWNQLRGYTAPAFLMISGCVFSYLLLSSENSSKRVEKGLKRAFLLLIVGYYLKFPSIFEIFRGTVSTEKWVRFQNVDILQCIAFGLLILIGSFTVFKHRRFILGLSFSLIIILLGYEIMKGQEFTSLPIYVKAYLNNYTGSLFPLFPWTAYVVFGGFIGYSICMFSESKSRILVFLVSLLLLITSIAVKLFVSEDVFYNSSLLILSRAGGITLLISLCLFLYPKDFKLPDLLLKMSKYSLWIYIFHLMILYWFLPHVLDQKLGVLSTIIALITMYLLVIGFSIVISKAHQKVLRLKAV